MYTPYQLAEITGVSRVYVHKLIRNKKLRAVSLSGGKVRPRYFLEPEELQKLEDLLDRNGYYSSKAYKNKKLKNGKIKNNKG